ncbi:MAG: sugar ABC transporter permease [Nitrososphaeria archaeon]
MLKHRKFAYFSTLPFVVIIVGFAIYLVGNELFLSFTQSSGQLSLANYVQAFNDKGFWGAGVNTIIWTVSSVIGQMIVGLLVGIILLQIKKGSAFYRTILIVLPWATTDIVTALLWQWMYDSTYGVINGVLEKIGLISSFIPWLGQPSTAMLAVVIANIWKGYPVSAMFYLAGLQQIPNELYEASEIDGANFIQRFIFITLPMMRRVILIVLMLTTIWTINYFPLIYIMTNGGPNGSTETLVTYIYRQAFFYLNTREAAAMSVILLLIIGAIASIYLLTMNKGGVQHGKA